MTVIIAFFVGLFLGGGAGFLIVGVIRMESSQEDLEKAQLTIKKQAETIVDQSRIIGRLMQQVSDLEDDGK